MNPDVVIEAVRHNDVSGHLQQAGREVLAAARDAGNELGKFDITIETFIRAHCNSMGKHIDELEDGIAEAFLAACNRVRGVKS